MSEENQPKPTNALMFALTIVISFAAAFGILSWLDRRESGKSATSVRTANDLKVAPLAKPSTIAQDGTEVDAKIPVPPTSKLVNHLKKPDQWGGRYQGFFESRQDTAAIRAFFAKQLPVVGWRPHTVLNQESSPGGGKNMVYVRGNRMMWINFFKPVGRKEGADFRLSILSRPHQYDQSVPKP